MKIPLSYSFRNLWTRKLTTALTAGGMALVVFVFATVLMLEEGLRKTLVETGSHDNVVVIRRSSQTEVQSVIDRVQAAIIESQPQVALSAGGERLVSRETVVLVTQPQRGGPFGVIVNRPLNRRLEEALPQYETLKGKKDVVYFGGPVARQALVFVVRSAQPPPRAIRVLKDVYITVDREEIEGLLKRPDPTKALRVYAGHSGWAPGQLQNEIRRGGWHIVPADAETVFEKDAATIWHDLSKRAALRRARITGDVSGAWY